MSNCAGRRMPCPIAFDGVNCSAHQVDAAFADSILPWEINSFVGYAPERGRLNTAIDGH
jgi:hypothetical protein